jgi:AcrR family transcriptional regulator
MPRHAKFDEAQILASTMRLVAADGPSAATMAAIAGALCAPTGSIYHRFPSRDVLLGEVWLGAATSFQDGFFALLGRPAARDAGLAAALYVPQRVRANLVEARILLLYRREDFLAPTWPEEMRARARGLQRQVDVGLQGFSRRLFGRADHQTRRLVTYAVLDAPLAAVRRHVAANEIPLDHVDALIRATYFATLALGEEQAADSSAKRRRRARRAPATDQGGGRGMS